MYSQLWVTAILMVTNQANHGIKNESHVHLHDQFIFIGIHMLKQYTQVKGSSVCYEKAAVLLDSPRGKHCTSNIW